MTARQLVRYLRLQWPRLLPEAIEASAGLLLRARWLELEGERLRPRGPG